MQTNHRKLVLLLVVVLVVVVQPGTDVGSKLPLTLFYVTHPTLSKLISSVYVYMFVLAFVKQCGWI